MGKKPLETIELRLSSQVASRTFFCRSVSGGSKEDLLSMLQSPERKTPVPTDTMAKLRQAASTFPKTPSIIRHIPLTDPELSEVDKSQQSLHVCITLVPSYVDSNMLTVLAELML